MIEKVEEDPGWRKVWVQTEKWNGLPMEKEELMEKKKDKQLIQGRTLFVVTSCFLQHHWVQNIRKPLFSTIILITLLLQAFH